MDVHRTLLDEAMCALDDTAAPPSCSHFENKSSAKSASPSGTSDHAAQNASPGPLNDQANFSSKAASPWARADSPSSSPPMPSAAPVGLAITISSAATLVGTTLATTAFTATKAIAMTFLQKTIVTATIAVLAGAGIYQTIQTRSCAPNPDRNNSRLPPLKSENESLASRPPPTAAANALPNDRSMNCCDSRGQSGSSQPAKTELETSLVKARTPQPPATNPVTEPPPQPALPEGYPKTADAATKGIFNPSRWEIGTPLRQVRCGWRSRVL